MKKLIIKLKQAKAKRAYMKALTARQAIVQKNKALMEAFMLSEPGSRKAKALKAKIHRGLWAGAEQDGKSIRASRELKGLGVSAKERLSMLDISQGTSDSEGPINRPDDLYKEIIL